MTASTRHLISLAAIVAVLLAGCSSAPEKSMSETHTSWESAKAHAQMMELEIASLIPASSIVSVAQKPTGILFPCSEAQHTWYGSTTVLLAPGSDVGGLVKTIEEHYREDGRFDVRTRVNFAHEYEVQLMSPTSAETYIFGKTDADTIRIDSGSVCFTLPEGVYPGGKF